jgi:hypothetical protein
LLAFLPLYPRASPERKDCRISGIHKTEDSPYNDLLKPVKIESRENLQACAARKSPEVLKNNPLVFGFDDHPISLLRIVLIRRDTFVQRIWGQDLGQVLQ